MKKLLSILTVLSFSIMAVAQNPTFEWAKGFGGAVGDYGQSLAVDASGNVYTTGYFRGTVDFDPGIGVYNLTSVGFDDIFVQKMDAAGNFLWAKAFGGTDADRGYAIYIDDVGDVYTTGSFSGTADFNPDAGIANFTSAGLYDIFVQKMDAAGNFIWAKTFGGTSNDFGYSICIDPLGNVYTSGDFAGTVDFNPDAGSSLLTSAGSNDIFVQKMDAAGNFLWAKAFGGVDIDEGNSIRVDDVGNVYTTGAFQGTVDFDPGVGTTNFTSAGFKDIFVHKMDATGNFLWAKTFGGTSNDVGYSISIDASGRIYTAGTFHSTVDFDPGAGTSNLTGNQDIFVQKMDNTGNFIWAKAFGGTNYDYVYSMCTDAIGNVYTTGTFGATADFDPGTGVYNLTSVGFDDIFVQKMDAAGNFLWAKALGGTSGDYGYSINVDDAENVYTTGAFWGTVDFDPGVGTANLSSVGGYDIYVHKMSQCTPTYGTDTQTACDAFTWIDGITYTTDNNSATHVLTNSGGCDSTVTLNLTLTFSNGGTDTQSACDTYDWIDGNTYTASNNTATYTLSNVAGCDSVVTLDLTINSSNSGTDVISACVSYNWIDGNTYTASNNTATYILTNQAGCDSTVTLDLIINPLPDNNVTQTDVTLSANQASAQYQWLDCDNSYSQINGETNQTYTSGVTGNYAVEVTVNGCADTSACFLVDYSGIVNLLSQQIQIYPNPTNDGMMFIHYDGQINAIEVMDMTGRKVSSSVVIENNKIDASKLSMGNYLIHISTNEGVVVKEVTIIK